MDLVLLFKVLLKNKWTLILVPFFAACIAFVLSRNIKEQYKSSTQLSTGYTIVDQVSITEGKFNLYEIEVKFSNLIEIFKSSLVMNLLGYELFLHDLNTDESFKRLTKQHYESNLFLSDIDFDQAEIILQNKVDSLSLLDAYIQDEKRITKLLELYKYDPKSLRETLNIQRVNRTDYISITAVTDNPEFSAYMVNKLYEVYRRYNASEESLRTVESVQKWKVLVDQKKEDLDIKTEELRLFKASNNLLNFEVESTSKIEQLSKLESDLDEENKKTRRLTLEIQNTKAQIKGLESGAHIESPVSNSELLDLRNRINDLNSRYEASGRSNESIADSLSLLRTRLQRLAAISSQTSDRDRKVGFETLLKDLETQLRLTEQNITSVQNNIRSIKQSIGGFAGYEARVATLEKEVELSSQEYLWAQEKYNQAVDIASATSSSVRQVVKGQPATKPEPSKKLIITALAGASTFILCFVFIIILEYLDTSIKTPSNFQQEVGLTLLGSINKLEVRKSRGKDVYRHFDLNTQEKLKKNTTILKRVKRVFKGLILKVLPFLRRFTSNEENTYDLFNDQIRKIRFELSNHEKKVILFTSTKRKEGKTEMIISLAESLSMGSKRILLVDTNFGHSSITRFYNATPFLGSDEHGGTLPDDFSKMISTTDNKFVDVLGCKEGNYSPFEILPKQDFFDGINQLLEKYDFIFIEGPAINFYSDTKELSGLAQGVLSVFGANSVIRQSDKESILFLKNLNGKFIGSILNKVEYGNINQ